MKTILTITAIISAFAFSSCNKCYDCTSNHESVKICKGDWKYDNIKSGRGATDEHGDEYVCF